MANLLFKTGSTVLRLSSWITSIPKLSYRLLRHMSYFIPLISYQLPCRPKSLLLAIGETMMYLLEILGIPAMYDAISEWIKPTTRPLSDAEISLSKTYFKDTINYDLVRIYPSAHIIANKSILAYVSFNTINHWRPIPRDVFIHEMMHIWQYQNLGAVYAIKALHAQSRSNTYDYAGFEGLYHAMLQGRDLLSYNFEQQAEIIQDYYKLHESDALNPLARSVYSHFTNQVLNISNI